MPIRIEGDRPRRTLTPQQTNPKDRAKPQRESAERQPIPGVWDTLERQVKLYTPNLNRTFNERARERREVNRCHTATSPDPDDLRGGHLGVAVGGG
jgi:hypothetical protein